MVSVKIAQKWQTKFPLLPKYGKCSEILRYRPYIKYIAGRGAEGHEMF